MNTLHDFGLWFATPGELRLVAREGDRAAGTRDGVLFDTTTFASPVSDPVANATGLAFAGSLSGPGVTAANNLGVWATDPFGALQLLLRTGDLFDVGGGGLRTLSDIDILTGGGEGGRPTSFNDSFELAFKGTFTDGTAGVFVVTVPESASHFCVLAMAGIILFAVPKRRGAT